MKLSELKTGMDNISITADVSDISEPRSVMTKFGSQVQLTTVTVTDGDGNMKLVLWGDLPEGLDVGKKVEIANGFVKEFRGELQLGISRGGKVSVVE